LHNEKICGEEKHAQHLAGKRRSSTVSGCSASEQGSWRKRLCFPVNPLSSLCWDKRVSKSAVAGCLPPTLFDPEGRHMLCGEEAET